MARFARSRFLPAALTQTLLRGPWLISALSCNATESPGAPSQSGDNAEMKQLLTCKDTAIQLRLNLTDVNTLIESGELPYSVICGQVRISQSDIMEAVNRLRIDQKSLPALRTNECPL